MKVVYVSIVNSFVLLHDHLSSKGGVLFLVTHVHISVYSHVYMPNSTHFQAHTHHLLMWVDGWLTENGDHEFTTLGCMMYTFFLLSLKWRSIAIQPLLPSKKVGLDQYKTGSELNRNWRVKPACVLSPPLYVCVMAYLALHVPSLRTPETADSMSSQGALQDFLSSLSDMAKIADTATGEESEQSKKMELHYHPFYRATQEVAPFQFMLWYLIKF